MKAQAICSFDTFDELVKLNASNDFRAIQRNFVDMENMFDLLREDQEVIDAPGAGPIICKKGAVDFNNVSFGYVPERLILKNVTFSVPSGKTVALVSTCNKNYFSFYTAECLVYDK